MRLIDIFERAIKLGIKNDIRADVDNKIFYALSENPYPDSAVLYGDNEKIIKNLFVCIDIDVAEVLLVDQLIKKGYEIDGILSHHPSGKGLYNITGVIGLQKENWQRAGVKEVDANKLFEKIYWEESIDIKGNHNGPENAAEFLGIPLMCAHTPIDNIIQGFFQDFFINKENMNIEAALDMIKEIPECRMASEKGDVPFIINTAKSNKIIGRHFIDMTGGVDPPDEIFGLLKKAGIDTIIGMHYNQDNINAIIKSKLSALICGHMACDSIGMNIFCDILEKEGVNIITGSGFYRYSRNGKD